MTQAKMKLKKGDEVVVIAGKDKGKKGSILKVLASQNRVFVAGVNVVKKHKRADQTGEGGIVEKELSIHASNVALADPKTGKPSRVGYTMLKDGKKVRVAKKSGEVVNA